MVLTDLPALHSPPTVTAAEMAEADRRAIQTHGIPEVALMETAARQIARVARALLRDDVRGKRIVVLAGNGNNGGDALAAARVLHGWGAHARAVLAREPDELRPLPRMQAAALASLGVTLRRHGQSRGDGADLIVDGLLGYGARGAPTGVIAEMIEPPNRSGLPILAIDMPSGVDADRGKTAGLAIRATCVVTLGAVKTGLIRLGAGDAGGPELVLADIGIPPEAYGERAGEIGAPLASSDLIRIIR